MKIVFDYLSGLISGQDFIVEARANPDIPNWLQQLIPDGADTIDKPYIPYRIENGCEIYQRASSSHPFWTQVYCGTCLNILQDKILFHEYFAKTRDFCTAGGRLDAYEFLFSFVRTRFPSIERSNRFDKELGFYLDVCRDYFGGDEVEEYLDNLIYEVYCGPGTLSKKRAHAKELIREAFHVVGNTFPRWIQAPEWPMGQNTPMLFLKRKRNGELVQFIFQDVDTGEIRVIEQMY